MSVAHQDPHLLLGEPLQRSGPMHHAEIRVQGLGADAVTVETRLERVGPRLGSREDQDLLPIRILQKPQQQVRLHLRLHRVHQLGDPLGLRSRWSHLDPDGLPGDARGQVVDAVGHGCREQHGLPIPGSLSQHPLDLRAKAHVEHAVRFVEDQRAHRTELDPATSHVIEKTARRGSDDLHALLESIQLRAVTDPAVDRRRPDLRSLRQGLGVVRHLLGKLPGGAQHQDLKSATRLDLLQAGDHEGAGLSRTGLGDPHEIVPLEPRRDALRLNGSRTLPPQGLDGGAHCVRYTQGLEGHALGRSISGLVFQQGSSRDWPAGTRLGMNVGCGWLGISL